MTKVHFFSGLAFVSFVFVSACDRGGKARAATEASIPGAVVSQATLGNVNSTLKVTGQFEPYQEVDLHAKVSGYIRRINVDIGDRVKAGQVIAALEVPELNAQVSAAQAEVRQSQSEINRAKSESRAQNQIMPHYTLLTSVSRKHRNNAPD